MRWLPRGGATTFARGLYLFDDALLAHLHAQDCTLVPWQQLDRIAIEDQRLVLTVGTDRLTIPGTLGDLTAARDRIEARAARAR